MTKHPRVEEFNAFMVEASMQAKHGLSVDELVSAIEQKQGKQYFKPKWTHEMKLAFVYRMLDELENAGLVSS